MHLTVWYFLETRLQAFLSQRAISSYVSTTMVANKGAADIANEKDFVYLTHTAS